MTDYTPILRGYSDDRRRDELAGIELHIDRLDAYIKAGYVEASTEEISMLRSLSERVGGFTHSMDSPAHAISYSGRLKRMMAALGAFYAGLEE